MRRTKTTPRNLHKRRFKFGGSRFGFEPVEPALPNPAWEARLGQLGHLRVRMFYRPGGTVNWIASVWFHWLSVDPESAEGQDPKIRLAVTNGQTTPEEALQQAEKLSVWAFTLLGDSLGYDVEQ